MGFIPLLSLLLVSAFWGGHAVVGKAVEHQLAPLSLTVWRFTLGALLYLPWAGRMKRVFRLPRRLFWQLALSGLAWAVLYPLLYYQSLTTLAPVQALLLVNTSPFLAALLGWVFLRERPGRWQWIGICVSFAGVLVMVFDEWAGSFSMHGLLLALLSALAFAVYTVSSRALFQTLPLFDVLVGTSFWGAVMLWLITAFTGQTHAVAVALAGLTTNGWLEFLYIVLFVSTISYVLYGYGLRRLPAGMSSALTFYPQVVFAALIQWVGLGIIPTWQTALSAAFIFAGTAFMRRSSKHAGGDASGDGEVNSEQLSGSSS